MTLWFIEKKYNYLIVCIDTYSDCIDLMDGHRFRVFALQYNPSHPNIFISGGWDDTVQVQWFVSVFVYWPEKIFCFAFFPSFGHFGLWVICFQFCLFVKKDFFGCASFFHITTLDCQWFVSSFVYLPERISCCASFFTWPIWIVSNIFPVLFICLKWFFVLVFSKNSYHHFWLSMICSHFVYLPERIFHYWFFSHGHCGLSVFYF